VVDLAKAEERKAGFDKAVEMLGGLDIILNAAGIQRRHPSPDFPMEDWNDVLEVNLTAPFDLSQMAAREFLKKEQPSGKIINVSSMLAFFGGQTVPAYAASKGAVMQLTKALTNEWAGKGINVNAIAPGYMETDLNAALIANPQRFETISARIPKGRWGKADDMKGLAVFLSSPASDYICGAIIPVDGGYMVK
jgi:2-deoxy-D-gluconate 3-dehydrogenase